MSARAGTALALALGLAAWGAGSATAAAASASIRLASHRATYDLSLSSSPDNQTVAATGRMTFEVQEDCRAWATEQTLAIDDTDRDGGFNATRSDYATYETKDGRLLSFTMVSGEKGEAPTTIRGVARMDQGDRGFTVRYASPAGLVLHLPPGTLFPMAHTRAILDAAASGRRELSPVLFDGTGTDGAEYTHATILSWGSAASLAQDALAGVPQAPDPADRTLAALDRGRFHIAFYRLGDPALAPEYEIGMRYFANGVSDRLDMDFGAFRMAGTLRTLAMLPAASACGR